jgi:hypothetical protein
MDSINHLGFGTGLSGPSASLVSPDSEIHNGENGALCHCGELRLTVVGEPEWVNDCHCNACQRLHQGSPRTRQECAFGSNLTA